MHKTTCSTDGCATASYVRGYCRKHYAAFMKYGDPLGVAPAKPYRQCTIEGCTTAARTKSADLCKKHYHRNYRHGSVNADFRAALTAPTSRYKRAYAPTHPLADIRGNAYAHRIILFDHIGPGEHPCHWCGDAVEWGTQVGHPRNLNVDHINEDKGDNRPENLVPSCPSCNVGRSLLGRGRKLRTQGAWSVNDTISSLQDPTQRRNMKYQERAHH